MLSGGVVRYLTHAEEIAEVVAGAPSLSKCSNITPYRKYATLRRPSSCRGREQGSETLSSGLVMDEGPQAGSRGLELQRGQYRCQYGVRHGFKDFDGGFSLFT